MSKRKLSNYQNRPTSTGVHKKKKDNPGNYNAGRMLGNKNPGAELKAFDTATIGSNFAVSGSFTALNLMVTGNDFFNRVGRKVYMKKLHIQGIIENIATTVQDYGRMIILWDTQSNAGVPALTDIFQDANAAAGTSGFSYLNLNNRERFKILRNQKFYLPAVTNTAGVLTNGPALSDNENTKVMIDFTVDLKDMETIYNGISGGTIADITSGSLILLTTSAFASGYDFVGKARLRFYD
jgi:hypothetical protein